MIQNNQLYPLAFSQQQVWLDQQAFPDSPHVNVGGMGCINGALDLDQFEQTLQAMCEQNQALRIYMMGEQQQLVDSWDETLLDFADFTHYETQQQADDAILAWWQQTFEQPIDLQQAKRPWRIKLFKTSHTRYVITLKFHHLLMDGFAIALILHKLSTIYCQLSAKATLKPNDKPDFLQFVQESTKYAQSKLFEKDGHYWQQLLSQVNGERLIAKDEQVLAKANNHHYLLATELQQALEDSAENINVTVYHYYLAAIAVYFCRYLHPYLTEESLDQARQIVIGVPVRNRSGKKYNNALGMFIMVIPLPITIMADDTVTSLSQRIAKTLAGAYRHAKYPYHQIMADTKQLAKGQSSLFDILLAYETENFYVNFGNAPTSDAFQHFPTVARFPLSISIAHFHQHEPTRVAFEASNSYFSQAQVEQLGDGFQQLLQQFIDNPNQAVNQLAITSITIAPEQQQTSLPSYIQQFEQQARQAPNAVAIRYLNSRDGEIHTIDYQQLNGTANQLALTLTQAGLCHDQLVAVVSERKAETIMAYLAITKAGGAFLPLNPANSIQQLSESIEISGAAIVLCHQQLAANLTQIQANIIALTEQQLSANSNLANPNNQLSAKHLAYMMYTSGSSSTPKGVLVHHEPLSRRLAWLGRTFASSPQDIALQSIQLSFDPAIIEILLPLTHGGSIALPPAGPIAPKDLAHYAERFAASHIIFVPTLLKYFNQHSKDHPNLKLRIAISGGESLPYEMAKDFVNNTGAKLYNMYGPTEACVFATAELFDERQLTDPVSIGPAVADSRIYILDHHMQPLPTGAIGELVIAGPTVAKGYLEQTVQSNNQAFITDPFAKAIDLKQQMYRTGDKAYIDDNGKIHFIGRIDQQIKLNGQRIEPEQIESRLLEHPSVSDAAVKLVNQQLQAWLVKVPHTTLALTELKQHLAARLPNFMLPSQFFLIDAMPRQTSGKTDYRALANTPVESMLSFETANQANIQTANQASSTRPKNELEHWLLTQFQQALKQDLNTTSHFFSHGGNSIDALNLLSNIEKQFGIKLPLSMLIQHPSVAEFTIALNQQHSPILLQLNQSSAPSQHIFLAASGHGDISRFAPLAETIDSHCALYMLQPPASLIKKPRSKLSITELATLYVEQISKVNQHPITLAGFSVAGITMIEVAKQLMAKGISIERLVLIDTTYPRWFIRYSHLWQLCGKLVKWLRLEELSLNGRRLKTLFNDNGLDMQVRGIKSYPLTPLTFHADLIVTSGFKPWYKMLFRPWQQIFTQGVREHHLTGFHGSIFSSEHIEQLVNVLTKTR